MSVLTFEKNPEIISAIEGMLSIDDIQFSKEDLFKIMETAMAQVLETQYGQYKNTVVKIGRNDGGIWCYRSLQVVESNPDISAEITLEDALKIDEKAVVGSFVLEPISIVSFSDSMVRMFRSILSAQIDSEKKRHEHDKFSSMIGSLVSGTIKKVSSFGLLVLIGKTEAFLPKRNLIKQEVNSYSAGNHIESVIKEVVRSDHNPQIILTRTSDKMLEELMRSKIPEIRDGTVQVKSVARRAGSRAKVAVHCPDESVDPVGACIGAKGKKINPVTEALANERIDIIAWNQNLTKFTKECFKNLPIEKINIDNDVITVIASEENISSIIGKSGQNVALVSELLKSKVNVVSIAENDKLQSDQFSTMTQGLMKDLDVDEIIAQLLVAEGYYSPAKIVQATANKLVTIEGFDFAIASQIFDRASEVLSEKKSQDDTKIKSLIAKSEAMNAEMSLSQEISNALLKCEIYTVESLADAALPDILDDLEKAEFQLDPSLESEISDAIMLARKKVGMI